MGTREARRRAHARKRLDQGIPGRDRIVAQHLRRAPNDATQSARRGRIGVGEVEQDSRDAVAIYFDERTDAQQAEQSVDGRFGNCSERNRVAECPIRQTGCHFGVELINVVVERRDGQLADYRIDLAGGTQDVAPGLMGRHSSDGRRAVVAIGTGGPKRLTEIDEGLLHQRDKGTAGSDGEMSGVVDRTRFQLRNSGEAH